MRGAWTISVFVSMPPTLPGYVRSRGPAGRPVLGEPGRWRRQLRDQVGARPYEGVHPVRGRRVERRPERHLLLELGEHADVVDPALARVVHQGDRLRPDALAP